MIEELLSHTALPNLHPALVHFPVAFLPLALLFDLLALALRRQLWLDRAAVALYAAAALGGAAALKAGEAAADGLVGVPAAVQLSIGEHSDWAHYALWAMGALAALRLLTLFWEHRRRQRSAAVRVALLVAGAVSLAVLARAADLGGALVFRHGVAVQAAAAHPSPAPEPARPAPAAASTQESARDRLRSGEHGELAWQPLPGDAAALGEVLRPAGGGAATAVRWTAGQEHAAGLTLEVDGEALLLLPGTFGDVQVEAILDLRGYEGAVGLAHHVGDGGARGGYFTLSTEGEAELRDLSAGGRKVLAQEATTLPEQELTLAISAAGRHLKGLIDGRTVVHGHLAPGPDGACGLLLAGKGRLRLVEVKVIPLRGH